MSRPSRPTRRLRPEHFRPAMRAAVAAFPDANPHGVFGIAIERRRVRGRPCGYSTLSLFVERKQDDPGSAIEPIVFRHRGGRFAVVPDVVATGQAAVASRGPVPAFTGLHAGAAIRVTAGHRCAGGITCLLTADGRPTHLLTAGHLFPDSAGAFAVTASTGQRGSEVEVGRLSVNLLDRPGQTAIDVALVALNRDGIAMAIESAARPRMPRLRARPFDSLFVEAARLRLFLPRTGDYQPVRSARNRPNRFRVVTGCRPPHTVTDVITSDFANNTVGNSGTILMTDEGEIGSNGASSAVGAAIGFSGAMSLHEPLDRALRELRAETGRAFKVWALRGP